MGLESLIRTIPDGAPVKAGEVNNPLRSIDGNVRYLYELIQAAALGSTVYARRQPVEAEAALGMPVYLDPATETYRRGLASADLDQATGAVVTSPSSQVWGIVAAKLTATLADILVFGIADVDISAATADGPPAAGTYYLSAGTPGKLTRQKPPVSVAVLRRTPGGKVFVAPQFVDFLDRHNHYQFKLTCKPAGTTAPPSPGGRHVVTDGNALLPGWLPAAHASFAGKAPPGAVFGYNFEAHTSLKAAWPPVSPRTAELTWNKGLSQDVGFTGVPAGPGGLVVIDRNGLWWMSDCYGDVPWPLDYDSTVSASYSDSAGPECPRHNPMELCLYYTRSTFATDTAVVLSVHSADPRVKVACFGDATRPASTGHLQLALDLDFVVDGDAAPGYLALKGFDGDTGKFSRGPVAEGVYALSGNVNLAGSATTTRTIDGTPTTVHHGLVGVGVDPADTKELDVQLVRLDGAEEAFYGDPPVMYLEFVAGDQREYRGKVYVPYDLAVATPRLKLRFAVLGRATGTLPALTFSGRIVPRPADGLLTPLALPDDLAEFTITCPTTAAISANQYVEADSVGFAVAPGDTVFFTVRRAASDGYTGAVGILRQAAVVYSGA